MEINDWLSKFEQHWKAHDINQVIELFGDKVEYWETPQKLIPPENLSDEWRAIKSQSSIQIKTQRYISFENRHAVTWNLSYKSPDGETQNWAGTYLIELNDSGKCIYFQQTGEKS